MTTRERVLAVAIVLTIAACLVWAGYVIGYTVGAKTDAKNPPHSKSILI